VMWLEFRRVLFRSCKPARAPIRRARYRTTRHRSARKKPASRQPSPTPFAAATGTTQYHCSGVSDVPIF